MTNRAHVLLWTDNTAAYLDAIKAAGLADRVAVDTPAAQGEAVGRPARAHRGADGGGRAARPAADHAQAALGAGDDRRRRGLARAARPAAQASRSPARAARTPNRCPRTSSPRCSMSPSRYAVAAANQKAGKWVHTVAQPLTGKTLGILGPRRDRPGGGAHGLGLRHEGDRHQAPAGADGRMSTRCCRPSAPTRCWRSPTSCCSCCRRRRRPTTSSMPSGWRR